MNRREKAVNSCFNTFWWFKVKPFWFGSLVIATWTMMILLLFALQKSIVLKCISLYKSLQIKGETSIKYRCLVVLSLVCEGARIQPVRFSKPKLLLLLLCFKSVENLPEIEIFEIVYMAWKIPSSFLHFCFSWRSWVFVLCSKSSFWIWVSVVYIALSC